MRCERLKKWISVFACVTALLAACSREQPAPPTVTATASAAPPKPAAPSIEQTALGGSYDGAMDWFKSAPSFRFVIDEGGVHAEGTMTRPTVGAEKIEIRTGQDEWRAAAGPKGVTWEKRAGSAWKNAAAPPWGNHLYQRATFAFDPAKREGRAQLVATHDAHEGTTKHYRFTDANTGNVHDVWVSTADNHIERMTIGGVMEMTIQP